MDVVLTKKVNKSRISKIILMYFIKYCRRSALLETVSAARPRARVMASSGSDATRRHIGQPSTPMRTTRTGIEVEPARSIRAVRRATERGCGRQHRLAEGHTPGKVRCQFEVEQRTDEACDVGNGADGVTPTTYRDRAAPIGRITCFGSSRTRKTRSGPPLGSRPACRVGRSTGGTTRAECQRRSPVESPYATAVRRCGEQSQVDGSTG